MDAAIADDQNVKDLLALTPLSSLAQFQHSSPTARQLVQGEFFRRLEELLKKHGFNIHMFLDALRHFNCILAGPFVLSLLDPMGSETYNVIDVIGGDSPLFMLFAHFLEDSYGARLHARLSELPDFPRNSYRYALLFRLPRGKTRVRLIRAVHSVPQFLIPQYSATHLMNYIAPDHLVIAYPDITFSRRSIRLRPTLPPSLATQFEVATRRETVPLIDCTSSFMCGSAMRWFNDQYCTVIGLHEEYEVIGDLRWQLGGERCDDQCVSDEFLVARDGPL
ncbi:hypothetical protein BC629DRAFT_1599617 [Irpex lacteus]|nr:hypothetical protein BC629DRAFT_1599617 [Irpex lacteus]